jgi:thiamine pyrophosphate-dependent acetolactate synthase large subunit-like protein
MKDSGHIRYADFQDIDQASIFKMAGLAYSESVTNINQLLPLARNAFTIALAQHRCAHLAVPTNVQSAEIQARDYFCLGMAHQNATIPATRLQIETLTMALRKELESKRHVVIACGYRAQKYGRAIEKLAELMHAPIVTSFDGKGTVNEQHPLSFGVVGVYGNVGTLGAFSLFKQCDTVIGICVNDWTEFITNNSGLQIRRSIQIDETLVAGDSFRFKPSTVFVSGYLETSLNRVVSALEHSLFEVPKRLEELGRLDFSKLETHQPLSSSDVWDEIRKKTFVKPIGTPSTFLECFTDSPDITSVDFCHPAVFFNIMGDQFLDNNSVICADIGDNALWMASSLPAMRGQRFLTSEHLGIMGYALNSGIASALSSKGKHQTLVVAGDGAFQQSLNELSTLHDHDGSNVLVVVVVNGRLGRVQNESWGPGLKADGCHIGSPDFVKLFEAYGYPNGIRLSTSNKDAITEKIREGWKSAKEHGCCVIELIQDENVHPIMHKMKYDEITSYENFCERTRNPLDVDLHPSIDVSFLSHSAESAILEYLNDLTAVETSDSFWLSREDFFADPVAKTTQRLLDSLSFNGDIELFPTAESRVHFNAQLKATFLNAVPVTMLREEIDKMGTSNTHHLKMQFLACPKGFDFDLHGHPNIEICIPIVGKLHERRLIGAHIAPSALRQPEGDSTFLNHGSSPLKAEHLSYIMDENDDLAFVDRSIKNGKVLFNPIGSIHKSYTRPEVGCLLLTLWSGIHSNFDKNDCCRP